MKGKRAITSLVVAALLSMPLTTANADPQPPDDFWLAACVVAAVGAAGAMIYVVSKKCQPKYYWMVDEDTPPNFWVGNATRKECEINGWKRIGGPYNRPEDAPPQHPPATNVVQLTASQPLKIAAQTSTDGTHWTTVYQETCDIDDFGYFPTNAAGAMIRLELSAP